MLSAYKHIHVALPFRAVKIILYDVTRLAPLLA